MLGSVSKPIIFDSDIIKHLNKFQTCPACKRGRLLKGPNRISLDVRCDNPACGKEFWLAFAEGERQRVVSGGYLARNRPEFYGGPLRW